jgi:hypothetical protein
MGSSKTPEVVHPGEAAQAATGAAAAGEMMSVANQPIDQYGNLVNTMMLGPAQIQTQQALANRAAKQGAQAQMDIQSSVDPQAYAQRQMRMNAANKRLGELYTVDPTAFKYANPASTYGVPGMADLPDLTALRRNAAAIASNLSTASLNKAGADPRLNNPRAVKDLPYPGLTSASYY